MGDLLQEGSPDLPDLRFLGLFPLLQFFHDLLVDPCVEELPEDLLLAVGACPQKLHELSLGDHGDLHELFLCQPDDLQKLPVSLLLRVFRPVRHGERDRGIDLLRGVSLAAFPLQGADMSRDPPHGVHFPAPGPAAEGQLDKGLRILFSILALKDHTLFFVGGGTRLPVKRKDNGVENGRLPGTGISRDQEKVLPGL